MAVRINSISLDGNDRFTKINLPMSPVLNCRPATPPSDQESCHKSVSSEGLSPISPKVNGDGENSCCGENQNEECSKPSSPINNNSIPLNFKKIPSPSEWNSSPKRDQSISPSSSGHRRNSASSPNLSPRIPSHASSETHPSDIVGSPDNFSRSPKMCPELSQSIEVPPFHDSRISPDSFKYIPDPMNPYLRLPNPLNPFAPTPNFLNNPFLASDPKVLLNHHLISQYHLNKIHPGDLKDFSLQQLQFLQNRLQTHQLPFPKFPEKNSLSLLMRKNPEENPKKEISFRPLASKLNKQDPKTKFHQDKRRSSEDNDSDSDELLSVGSESPPPNCQSASLYTDNESDAGSSSLDCSFKNRTNLFDKPKKYQNNRGQNANNKSVNANNRTLKFSIDNILKSDFGGNDNVIPVVNSSSNLSGNKKPCKESKKEKPDKESERTTVSNKEVKKSEGEKESPVDLSQDNSSNNGSGSEAPMLWPAWVYCTRYSDRPSSGRSPRTRRSKNKEKNPEEKRPRTAFSGDQLSRLKHEFAENRYLTERRRQDLARELGLNEAQIKIWFQNKRAKMKKARGEKNPLALQLMAQGLYNHSTVPLTREEEEAAAAEMSD